MNILRINGDNKPGHIGGSFDVSHKHRGQDIRQAHTVVRGHVDAVWISLSDEQEVSNRLVSVDELATVWRRHLRTETK